MDIVSNEFAEVSVRVDGDANTPRLRLEDLRALLDPAADRWKER